jgi:cell division protein FtsN
MRRDYAKSMRRRRRRGESHIGLWLLTIALFIGFTFGLVYLGKHRQQQTQMRNYVREVKAEAEHKLKESAPTRFEFTTPQELERAKKDKEKDKDKEKRKGKVAKGGAQESPASDSVEQAGKQQEQSSVQQSMTALQVQELQPGKKEKAIKASAATNTANADGKGSRIDDDGVIAKPSASAVALRIAQTKTKTASAIEEVAISAPPRGVSGEQGRQYVLEVIKSKNYTVADRIRAKLALMGYESTIATVREQNKVYYRLTLGPFASKAEATVKQQALVKNKMPTNISQL